MYKKYLVKIFFILFLVITICKIYLVIKSNTNELRRKKYFSVLAANKINVTLKESVYYEVESNNLQVDNFKKVLLDRPNDLVYQYVSLPLDSTKGSISVPLAVAALLTTGDILEIGAGEFSTPVVHNICSHHKRNCVSVDKDKKQLNKFIHYNKTLFHTIQYANDLITYTSDDQIWGLVSIDHTLSAYRYKNAIYFAASAQIVVLHDAEATNEKYFNYEKHNVQGYYRYVCKFSLIRNEKHKQYTSTLIMSNYIELYSLSEIFAKINTDYKIVACDFKNF